MHVSRSLIAKYEMGRRKPSYGMLLKLSRHYHIGLDPLTHNEEETQMTRAEPSGFAQNLRAARQRLGYTQEELARVLGTSKQVISRYEHGQRDPKSGTIRAWAEKLNVPAAYLIDSTPAEKGAKDMTHSDRIALLQAQPGETVSPRILAQVLGGDAYAYNVAAREGKLSLPHVWRGRNLRIIKEPLLKLLQGGLENA